MVESHKDILDMLGFTQSYNNLCLIILSLMAFLLIFLKAHETEENQHFLLSIKKVMILLFVEALMV